MFEDVIILEWDQRRNKCTLKLDKQGTNIGELLLAPGYPDYQQFVEKQFFHHIHMRKIICPQNFPCPHQDDEESIKQSHGATIYLDDEHNEQDFPLQGELQEIPMTLDGGQHGIDTMENDTQNIILDEEDIMGNMVSAEFLQLHNLLGHISMMKMQETACQGLLPSKFATCNKPTFTTSLYRKDTKNP